MSLSGEGLYTLIKTIWKSYKCSNEQVVDLERETRGQAVCPLWFEKRKGRITVTKAHDELYLSIQTDRGDEYTYCGDCLFLLPEAESLIINLNTATNLTLLVGHRIVSIQIGEGDSYSFSGKPSTGIFLEKLKRKASPIITNV